MKRRKRKRSDSNTSLSYNRIEEELMAGIDNPLTVEDESAAASENVLI